MINIDVLLDAGVQVAAMSDQSDGDCGWEGATTGTRDHFLSALHIPPREIAIQRQVHGILVRPVRSDTAGRGATNPLKSVGDGDGLITNVRNLPLGVTVADCVPILLFDPRTGAIGALHAGREGTTGAIAVEGVRKLVTEFGVRPEDIQALIAPSAGPCCYEVSSELRDRCAEQGVITRGRHLDLWETNRSQLRSSGVKDAHITVSKECTICSDRFFSYRRQQTKARNLAVIMG